MDAIEVRNLRKRYGETVAVEDVSFSVREGEIFGVLGPNGAGKTTTVECIAGLRTPDAGRLRVLGRDPSDPELRRLVGVQLQDSALPDRIRVGEALELYRAFYEDPEDVEALIEALGLGQVRGTAFGRLSGGERQRLSIALALIGRPRLAILDELTTGLDPQARRATWALIEHVRARGVTILLVTHFMEEAERLCDRVAVIDRGRVVALDAPAALGSLREQRLRFRPSAPVADEDLLALPDVATVRREGELVVVSGGPAVVQNVAAALARAGIVAERLRVEHANLEDAFVELTR
ncbi:ABC transporter ATP-binding protein [Candidatus Solirubrobacter pratensis]|uniref:ABC transporter ATP-binding protein n=1 Tax=Candidatus Solirubrobacter pratensis TaxID=1298857 RepID=UPI00041D4ECB|nr:ABC transporter ATP-binding protein [Candidatus Solirubrobacter pratensis]